MPRSDRIILDTIFSWVYRHPLDTVVLLWAVFSLLPFVIGLALGAWLL